MFESKMPDIAAQSSARKAVLDALVVLHRNYQANCFDYQLSLEYSNTSCDYRTSFEICFHINHYVFGVWRGLNDDHFGDEEEDDEEEENMMPFLITGNPQPERETYFPKQMVWQDQKEFEDLALETSSRTK